MDKMDRTIQLLQLGALIALGYGGYELYKYLTAPRYTQNGQPYSIWNCIFLTPNINGQIYDSTGTLGAYLASGDDKVNLQNSDLTNYALEAASKPGFTPGIPGVSINQ